MLRRLISVGLYWTELSECEVRCGERVCEVHSLLLSLIWVGWCKCDFMAGGRSSVAMWIFLAFRWCCG